MRDGKTQVIGPSRGEGGSGDLKRLQARIVIVSGSAAGAEYPLSEARITLGRGPGVDLPFDDPAMSRQHAVIEFVADAFHIRDLGSTNGLRVNDRPSEDAELAHGDRFQIGSLEFQMLIEVREASVEVYELEV